MTYLIFAMGVIEYSTVLYIDWFKEYQRQDWFLFQQEQTFPLFQLEGSDAKQISLLIR